MDNLYHKNGHRLARKTVSGSIFADFAKTAVAAFRASLPHYFATGYIIVA